MLVVIFYLWFVSNAYAELLPASERCTTIEMKPLQQQYCTGNNMTARMFTTKDCKNTVFVDKQGHTCQTHGYECCFVNDTSYRISNNIGYVCCSNKSSDSHTVIYIIAAVAAATILPAIGIGLCIRARIQSPGVY